MKWWVSSVLVRLPESGDSCIDDQLLSDYCDANDVIDFIRLYPDCNIVFTKTSDTLECYGAFVDYEYYRNWTEDMKNYWKDR